MPWNWEAYWDQANALLKDRSEAGKRSATSRSYYFAHHRSCEYLMAKHGFVVPIDHRHSAVTRRLEQGNGIEKEVAKLLLNIYVFRLQADYESEMSHFQAKSAIAVSKASEIADILKRLTTEANSG